MHTLLTRLVFTKCKDNLENGRRLENLSWRLWYRETILLEKEKRACAEDSQSGEMDESHANKIAEELQRESMPPTAMNIPQKTEAASVAYQAAIAQPHQPLVAKAVNKRTALKHLNPTSFHRIITSLTPANTEKADTWRSHRSQQTAGAAGFSAPDQIDPHPLSTVSPPNLNLAVEEVASTTAPAYTHELSSNPSSLRIDTTHKLQSANATPASLVIRGFDSSKKALDNAVSVTEPKSKKIFFMPSSATESDLADSYIPTSRLAMAKSSFAPKTALKGCLKNVSDAKNSLPRMNAELDRLTSAVHVAEYEASGTGLSSEEELDDDEDGDVEAASDEIDEDDSDWDSEYSSSYSSSLDRQQKSPVFNKIERPDLARQDSGRGLLSTMFASSPSANSPATINRTHTLPSNLSALYAKTKAEPATSVTTSKPIPMQSSTRSSYIGAQSPRTTRRNMLATELSESLRRNLLWERQQKNMMTGKGPAMTRRHTSEAVRQVDGGGKLTMTPDNPRRQLSSKEINAFFTTTTGYHGVGW